MDAPPGAGARKPCCVCDAPNGKHCTKCKSRHYCGKTCQLVDWNERGHKAQCKRLAAEFQDRLLDELVPEKLKIKEAPAIVEAVAPAAGSTAAARAPVVRAETSAAAKAIALNDDTPDWRGTCGICLDLLPLGQGTQRFYECCCQKLCTECADKCSTTTDARSAERQSKHVDKGNAGAQLLLGLAYNAGGNGLKQSFERAVQLYELAAAQGHAMAQSRYNLGVTCFFGQGVKIDYKAAAQWFQRAAEQGHAEARFNLGVSFESGHGVAQSFEEAAKWYRLAAGQGDARALFNLGVCQDFYEALSLFQRAVAKGHASAAAEIERLRVYIAATRSR